MPENLVQSLSFVPKGRIFIYSQAHLHFLTENMDIKTNIISMKAPAIWQDKPKQLASMSTANIYKTMVFYPGIST